MRETTKRVAFHALMLAGGTALALVSASPAFAHGETHVPDAAMFKCKTAGAVSQKTRASLDAPYATAEGFKALQATPLWRNVVAHLRLNLDKKNPCFGFSDQDSWTQVVSRIPADIVAVQASADGTEAIVYVSGIPDYRMEMPKLFSSFKPGETYGIFRIGTTPEADDRPVHELASKGTIGIFVNGVSMFNYTDTFAYADKGIWSYDANVAEATIVNSDISHATPSNLPQFPSSRGIFHNHQVSSILLHQLKDPFVAGKREHSRLLGFIVDSNPVYGPIGYTSKDKSSGLKVLKSSYVPRAWLAGQGTGNRSSVPEWTVLNWNGSNASGQQLLNLFQKNKADVLFADGAMSGPVTYAGTDDKLAAEIKALQDKVGLKRDAQGYVYWESSVKLAGGKTATTKNYLLKTSDLWGPGFTQKILPASYQVADVDKFYFTARVGSFSEDSEYVAGYGDLDFYNGIDSYLPDRGASAYHYVTPFSGALGDKDRLKTASFPYFVGIQYKSRVPAFNDTLDMSGRIKYFGDNAATLKTIFDLGITGKDDGGKTIPGAVPAVWQKTLNEN